MKIPIDASTISKTPFELTDDAFLGGQLKLLQPRKGYRAGLDAVLLAAAIPESAGDPRSSFGNTLLDVGAGVGTVGLCAARRIDGLQVSLAERETQLIGLARENISRNGLQDRVSAHLLDLTARQGTPEACQLVPGSFAIVAANPPFNVARRGTMSEDTLKRGSHSLGPDETLEQWCQFLARMCRPGGLAIMIHTTEGLQDVIQGLNGRFGGLIIQPLHPREGTEANRILVAGRKGRRTGTRLLPGIPIHTDGRNFTSRIASVLRDGAGLELPI